MRGGAMSKGEPLITLQTNHILNNPCLVCLNTAWLPLLLVYIVAVKGHDFNYREALSKSLIFLEAQRSGKLPPNNRLPWRGDSGLDDGKEANVPFFPILYLHAWRQCEVGLPMAFTVTTLAWSAIAFKSELKSADEMENVRAAIRWGTDYFLKAAAKHDRLLVTLKRSSMWVRPEDMKGPRPVLQINSDNPGTEIAGETSAAMAAASMVFRLIDAPYARRLLNKAKLLFEFADEHKKTFDGECPFYCSFSGFHDELSWAAAWLYTATHSDKYFKYIKEETVPAVVDEFNWDLKYAGVQVLLSKSFFEGTHEFHTFKEHADSYICAALPESPYRRIPMTPGGLIHLRDGANLQYVTGASFLFSIYGDGLHIRTKPRRKIIHGRFGKNPPTQAHHRGASVPLSEAKTGVDCGMSFVRWFNKNAPNPNELTGAILGGPDKQDKFSDLRWTSVYTEPCTYVNSLAVGALAKLTRHHNKS
ncbi:Endoglucanase 8 [Hibiscus syriacus]|uniref:cellulase n=1 Tax=Hibiscus syriacus TaxID=106335 RepID=A0A6A3CY32_HIBSY|nr:Endoglucanase 8 [Hibiscus syriacus]